MEPRPVYSSLMLLGALPFVACALLPFVGVEDLGPLGAPDQLAIDYGLAIVCFLTGVHWATQLYASKAAPFNLFIASNAIFLFVWFTYVAASLQWALATQLLSFLLLLAIDFRLLQNGLIAGDYLRMRIAATTLACISLFVILVS
jgi:hypothetical protein